MKLIVISKFHDIPNEHFLLNLLFCEGLQYFHLRKKDYTLEKMEAYIRRIPTAFHQYIVLHSHFELIEKYNLKGAHFTKNFSFDDYKSSQPQNSDNSPRGQFGHASFSLHTIQEIKKTETAFDYIFLSPVFDSISNTGYNSKFRVNELKRFLDNKTNRSQIIALSGITDNKIEKIHELGFDGLALLGHIWSIFENDQDIIAATKRFNHIKKLIKPHTNDENRSYQKKYSSQLSEHT